MKFLKTFIQITITKVKSRPTKYFSFIIISIFVLFLQAYMHNFNIVFIVMFFIFAIAGASGLIGRLNIFPIEVSLLSANRFFANELSYYRLSLNNIQKSSAYSIEVYNDKSRGKLNKIEPYNQGIIELNYIYNKRGEHKIEWEKWIGRP